MTGVSGAEELPFRRVDIAGTKGMPEPKSPSASDRIEAREVAAEPARIVTVRPPAETVTRQHLPYFVGISRGTAGATGVSMHMVVIPPGAAAKPHLHHGYETAIYLLEGRVETRYGPGLAQSVFNQAGDFIFIPADVPHQPINLSTTDPARAIVARNDPNEQESVELYEARPGG